MGEADGDSSAVLVFFFVVEEVAASVPEVFFFVAEEVALAVPDFLVVDDCFLAVLEVAVVSFLLAHAVTKASAAKMAIKDRTGFFIGWLVLTGATDWSVVGRIASIYSRSFIQPTAINESAESWSPGQIARLAQLV